MPKRKGRRLTPYSQTGPVGRAVKATGTEWKEVEKLAVEVALHPEAFVGGDEALANRLVLATKHLFDLGNLPPPRPHLILRASREINSNFALHLHF
jgi:hypothetical protein